MSRPIHFEIPAENPERAKDIYSTVFGWEFRKWEAPVRYCLITAGDTSEPGINGGLMLRHDPAQACVNTMSVSNPGVGSGTN
jgi:hypothetical protein